MSSAKGKNGTYNPTDNLGEFARFGTAEGIKKGRRNQQVANRVRTARVDIKESLALKIQKGEVVSTEELERLLILHALDPSQAKGMAVDILLSIYNKRTTAKNAPKPAAEGGPALERPA